MTTDAPGTIFEFRHFGPWRWRWDAGMEGLQEIDWDWGGYRRALRYYQFLQRTVRFQPLHVNNGGRFLATMKRSEFLT